MCATSAALPVEWPSPVAALVCRRSRDNTHSLYFEEQQLRHSE
jgi:hypothetical protein